MAKTLAVQYRPKTWDEVQGQGSTKIILQQQLESGDIRSAYAFIGASGCGKTTCARIFANEINKGQGSPIELDAASHNGVDDAREIIKMAQTRSLDSEYKVLIVDECFPAQTVISTPEGDRSIALIKPGDYVNSMSDIKKVTHVFKNSVLTLRLCSVNVGNRSIVTTVDHLFFTNNGWIRAIDLQKGDILYANNVSEEMFKLWKGIPGSKQSQRGQVLLSSLFSGIPEETSSVSAEEVKDCAMSDLWKRDVVTGVKLEENLLKGVYGQTNFKVRKDDNEYRIWDEVKETIIRKNEAEQSYESFRNSSEDAGDEGQEWNPTQRLGGQERWQWEVHNSTDSLIRSIRNWLGIGVCNQHKESELARTETTLVLQSRPRLSRNETCSRGGWQRPQLEAKLIKRCEENGVLDTVRVESVEIYKRGSNDELFRRCFTDTELSGEYVTMYDLEVEDDHAYFADGILVHNCHMFSAGAWAAMLKLIEEPPAKSIFIFCTTNPEKIPKTILNRVQQYTFKRIPQDEIVERLKYVIEEEGKDYDILCDTKALEFIARQSKGQMRDALALLDKCLAYSTEIVLDNVLTALELSDVETFTKLTEAVLEQNRHTVIDVIEKVYADGEDMKQFIKQYMNFVLDVTKWLVCEDFKYTQLAETKEMKKWLEKYNELDTFLDLLDRVVEIDSAIKFSNSAKEYIETQLITF